MSCSDCRWDGLLRTRLLGCLWDRDEPAVATQIGSTVSVRSRYQKWHANADTLKYFTLRLRTNFPWHLIQRAAVRRSPSVLHSLSPRCHCSSYFLPLPGSDHHSAHPSSFWSAAEHDIWPQTSRTSTAPGIALLCVSWLWSLARDDDHNTFRIPTALLLHINMFQDISTAIFHNHASQAFFFFPWISFII